MIDEEIAALAQELANGNPTQILAMLETLEALSKELISPGLAKEKSSELWDLTNMLPQTSLTPQWRLAAASAGKWQTRFEASKALLIEKLIEEKSKELASPADRTDSRRLQLSGLLLRFDRALKRSRRRSALKTAR